MISALCGCADTEAYIKKGTGTNMIHPSYVDLMQVVNKGVEEGETPVINSRYSIVMTTRKVKSRSPSPLKNSIRARSGSSRKMSLMRKRKKRSSLKRQTRKSI